MSDPHHAIFYLPDGLRQSAEAGTHNFIGKIAQVLEHKGFSVSYADEASARSQGSEYSIFHMQEPYAGRSVTLRRAYHYPFWQIETTNKRWEWEVARTEFPASEIPRKEADRFFAFWQKRLFDTQAQTVSKSGFIYLPLQGRLQEHRSFQTCSPVDMIRKTLANSGSRPVVATLHPSEIYSPSDHAILQEIAKENPMFQLGTGDMATLLRTCDFVVTQNSSVGFSANFFRKPVVLFGQIDFHHIAYPVSKLGIQGAFESAATASPDYAGFMWWFLQKMSINAGRPEAEDKISARLKHLGWPIEKGT
jgi:hypothetical protein